MQPSYTPFQGFVGEPIHAMGCITFKISFSGSNGQGGDHTEDIKFDVVDIVYPYNFLLGWRVINKFLVVIHHGYLCLKMSGPEGVITVCGDQTEARRLEVGMAPRKRHINVIEKFEDNSTPFEMPTAPKYIPKVQPQEGTKEVVLCVDRPEETISIGCGLSEE